MPAGYAPRFLEHPVEVRSRGVDCDAKLLGGRDQVVAANDSFGQPCLSPREPIDDDRVVQAAARRRNVIEQDDG